MLTKVLRPSGSVHQATGNRATLPRTRAKPPLQSTTLSRPLSRSKMQMSVDQTRATHADRGVPGHLPRKRGPRPGCMPQAATAYLSSLLCSGQVPFVAGENNPVQGGWAPAWQLPSLFVSLQHCQRSLEDHHV